jgi:SlyX protein
MSDLAERIDGLEIRIAHQDRTISELNEVITEQWRRIEILERQILRLREEMQNMTPAREAPEPPPPHY